MRYISCHVLLPQHLKQASANAAQTMCVSAEHGCQQLTMAAWSRQTASLSSFTLRCQLLGTAAANAHGGKPAHTQSSVEHMLPAIGTQLAAAGLMLRCLLLGTAAVDAHGGRPAHTQSRVEHLLLENKACC
jgi:hypothetical protein